jgi:hypothetical protein
MSIEYTKAELDAFRMLVEQGESPRQMERIHSRLEMPKFIKMVGKEKCDAMLEVLKKEVRA